MDQKQDDDQDRNDRPPVVRDCLNCKQQAQLIYDEHRGYHRGTCACGALCTTGTAGWRS